MPTLLWIIIPVALLIVASALFVRSSGRVVLALPIVIVAVGTLWIYGTLARYQRTTGRPLNGLVGYHHSVPEWGFKYAQDGQRIERWSFHVPAIVTIVLLVASAIISSMKRWRIVGMWRTLGVWLYHFGCAAAFAVAYGLLWIEAAGVFI